MKSLSRGRALYASSTLGNMDGVIGYSYTGLGNGVVVVI